jgi:hypothetical protein
MRRFVGPITSYEQVARYEEAQTHHEAESGSHRSNEAQVWQFDLYKTDKWQEIAEGQECQADAK